MTPTTTATATANEDADISPVIRGKAGLWAMEFVFGGLAPMSIAGLNDYAINRLFMTEIGFRRVLKNGWAIPFSAGLGVFHNNPDGDGGNQNDVGVSATVGVRKTFRGWRRINPYVGGAFNLHYVDPTGDNNWNVGFGIGPVVGIEYFVGNRVSLLLQGQANLGVQIFDGLVQVSAATTISAGGQMGLLFYF